MLNSIVTGIRQTTPAVLSPTNLDITASASDAANAVTNIVIDLPSRLWRNRFVQLFLACTVGTLALYIQLSTSISKNLFGTDVTSSPIWWVAVVPAQVVFVVYFLRFLMRFLIIDLGLSLLRSAPLRDALAALVKDMVLHAEVQDDRLAAGLVSLAAKVVEESNKSGMLNEAIGESVSQVILTQNVQDAVVGTLSGALRHPELPEAVIGMLQSKDLGRELTHQMNNQLMDILEDRRTSDAAAIFLRNVLEDRVVRQTALRRMKSMLAKPDIHQATYEGVAAVFTPPCPPTGCWSHAEEEDEVPSELSMHGFGEP